MQPRKLKVTFIHPDLGIGGAERLVLDVANALSKHGHEVSFVTNHCDKSHAFEEIKNDEFPVEVIGDWLPRSFAGRFQAFCAYMRMVYLALMYVFFIKKEADVYVVDQIPVAIPILKWTGKKIVYYCHHPDLLASPPGGCLKKMYRAPIDWIECSCTAEASVLLVNSQYTASVFRKTFPKIMKPLKILYPTISKSFQEAVSKIKRVEKITELVPEINEYKPDDVVFLSINRFHPAKNLELAINAMDYLKQRLQPNKFDKVHLIIAGGYDPQSSVNARYFSELVNITNSKGLEKRIIFLKSPSDKLKADLLLASDCLVYTPVNEHFGIVPLEAMACAKPVIACNSGGPRETVTHGVTGYLCHPVPSDMAECMEMLLDKEHRKVLGEVGKKRLQDMFSWNIFSEAVKEAVCVD